LNDEPPWNGGSSYLGKNHFHPASEWRHKAMKAQSGVFNIRVENSVEKPGTIFVNSSGAKGSAFCTAVGAGTWLLPERLPLCTFVSSW